MIKSIEYTTEKNMPILLTDKCGNQEIYLPAPEGKTQPVRVPFLNKSIITVDKTGERIDVWQTVADGHQFANLGVVIKHNEKAFTITSNEPISGYLIQY